MSLSVVLPRTKLLIDGDWADAQTGNQFTTFNPATEEVLAQVAQAGAADVDAAVAAARRALNGPWGAMTGAQRGRVLNRLAEILRQRFEEVVLLESLDGGKPLAATRRQDVANAIDTLEHYAGWADKLSGDVIPVRADALTYTRLSPVGVVAAIVPWNFPLMNAVWKVAPALACGCTVVMKPAELTPLSALWLGAAALEAGIPPGVLNVIPGPGTVAGNALVSHPGIDKIAFTGSPGVGKTIMRAAAEHVTRVGLELGGKAAAVVFADADLDAAVRQIANGAFFNAGQVCSAATRIIVEDSIYDEFVARLAARVARLRVGDPADAATTMGPVISRKQMDGVLGYIDIGLNEGAKLVSGGGRIGSRGYFVQPTVLSGVDGGMRIAQEEIFGPVVSVMRFGDEAEALRLANGTVYSLASAVWTSNVDKAHRAANRINAGTVWVNTYGPTDARLPWGGMGGESGIGRDLGRSALEAYTETKTIWLQLGGGSAHRVAA